MRRGALALAIIVACGSDDAAPVKRGPDSCKAPPLPGGASITLEPAFGGVTLASPVELIEGPGGRFYALEQAGLVRVLGGGAPATAYDVTKRVTGNGEAGLLGIAFDPAFEESHFVYLYFTENTTKPGFALVDTLVRVTSNDGGATFNPATEKVILAVDDPFPNHNGGHIAFGPDGFLYVGIGDGGSENDPSGNGQNKDVLFGKILRIDPKGGDPYAIPKANPFASGGGRPEIYAYGLRNPWKFSFDRLTGALWAGDVGQTHHEEIDLITLGGNYGWSTREGKTCTFMPDCPTAGLIDPVVDYPRTDGIAVTAGYVYRGTKVPALAGKLIYGDFGSGNIWSVDAGSAAGTLLTTSTRQISSFGQGADGEMYVVDYGSGGIFSIAPAPATVAPAGPLTLAATGCLERANAINYDVSPLWSDGAEKQRSLFVPDGKKINVGSDGDFEVPLGSVAVKTFSIGGKKIETRLFARYDDGAWAGWSYEWNDDQKDAVLLETGKTKALPNGQMWSYPSRSECLQCHTLAAGFTLGLEARQVDVATFASDVTAPIAPMARFAATDARAYLHSNCSICHRAGSGAGAATMDLRFDTALADMHVCNAPPAAGDLGIADAKIVVPGAPERSILVARMASTDEHRMPPLASHVVDATGLATISTWITTLACP